MWLSWAFFLAKQATSAIRSNSPSFLPFTPSSHIPLNHKTSDPRSFSVPVRRRVTQRDYNPPHGSHWPFRIIHSRASLFLSSVFLKIFFYPLSIMDFLKTLSKFTKNFSIQFTIIEWTKTISIIYKQDLRKSEQYFLNIPFQFSICWLLQRIQCSLSFFLLHVHQVFSDLSFASPKWNEKLITFKLMNSSNKSSFPRSTFKKSKT